MNKINNVLGAVAGAALMVSPVKANNLEDMICPTNVSKIEVGAIHNGPIGEFHLFRGKTPLVSAYSDGTIYAGAVQVLDAHNLEEGSVHLAFCDENPNVSSKKPNREFLGVEINGSKSDLGLSVKSRESNDKSVMSYSSDKTYLGGPWRPAAIFNETDFVKFNGLPLLHPANSGESYDIKVPGTVDLKGATHTNENGDECIMPQFRRNGPFFDIATLTFSDEGRDRNYNIRALVNYQLEKNPKGKLRLVRLPTNEEVCVNTPSNPGLENKLTLNGPDELILKPSTSMFYLNEGGLFSCKDDFGSYQVLGDGEFAGNNIDGLGEFPLQAWYSQKPVNVSDATKTEDILNVYCSNGKDIATASTKMVMDCPPFTFPTILADGRRNCE